MSETFYYIAKRAGFERQIIRKSQFSKNFDCGMSGTGNFGKLCGLGDWRNFADVSDSDNVPAGTIIEC